MDDRPLYNISLKPRWEDEKFWCCPCCGRVNLKEDRWKYCHICGQKIRFPSKGEK